MNQRRVLLVEDNPRDAEQAMEILSEDPTIGEVVHVRDGVHALDYLHRRNAFADRADDLPAVVLLDLKMPRMGGLEVIEAMKTSSQLRVVPVVVMTSSKEETDVRRSYQLGANAYIVKPLDVNGLVATLRQFRAFWVNANEVLPECL